MVCQGMPVWYLDFSLFLLLFLLGCALAFRFDLSLASRSLFLSGKGYCTGSVENKNACLPASEWVVEDL